MYILLILIVNDLSHGPQNTFYSPLLQKPVKLNSLLPETRCPLFPEQLRLQFSTLLDNCCSFSALSSSSSSAWGVNAKVLRILTRPLLHAGLFSPNQPHRTRAHTLRCLRASDLEKPAAGDCKVGEGQRGLSPHTNSPFPAEGTWWSPNGSQDWESNRGGPHARRRERGTSRALFHHRPRQKSSCAPPPPGPGEEVPTTAQGPYGGSDRQQRGQREKEGHSPASAPSPYSTGSTHQPVARVRKRGDIQPYP